MIAPKLVAASSVGIVLSILLQGESYGYAILQRVRQVSRGQLEWNEGMLYPVLHRLEQEGLVTARWDETCGARRRKYYRLSEKGAAQLVHEREQWNTVDAAMRELWSAGHA